LGKVIGRFSKSSYILNDPILFRCVTLYVISKGVSYIENFRDLTVEYTFAELYEDKHNRLDLRNEISNALMAISLYEVKSKSKNLLKYIEDGIDLSSSSLEALGCITGRCEKPNHKYVMRVLKKMINDNGGSNKTKYESYKKGFEIVKELFTAMNVGKEIEGEKAQYVKEFLIAFDKDLETTYEKEDSLYFGCFKRIPLRI